MKVQITEGTDFIPDIGPELLNELRVKIVDYFDIGLSFDIMNGKIEFTFDDSRYRVEKFPGNLAFFDKSDDELPALVYLEDLEDVKFYARTYDIEEAHPLVVIPNMDTMYKDLISEIRLIPILETESEDEEYYGDTEAQ